MYRPQINTYENSRFAQRSPYSRTNSNFSPRNNKINHFRLPGLLPVQNNYEFWCETCDKGFNTEQILENHKSQHQKCNIDGCQFVAHPKIITKHIQMQHSTGLYKKIGNLNNPEEIQKWREERKRKYPTKQNIEKKAAEMKEKIERGEKMGMFESRKKRCKPELHSRAKHNFGKNKYPARHNIQVNKHSNKKIHKQPSAKIPATSFTTENLKLIPFTGIQQIHIEENFQEECYTPNEKSLIEDDIFNEELLNMTREEPSVCGALSSLICNYGSSDEDCNDYSVVIKTTNSSTNLEPQCSKEEIVKDTHFEKSMPLSISNNDKSDDDSGPEEAVINKNPETINMKDDTKNVRPKTEKRVRRAYTNVNRIKKPRHQLPSTLLVKLLSREIQQERNIILQCVRHVVRNKFFDN